MFYRVVSGIAVATVIVFRCLGGQALRRWVSLYSVELSLFRGHRGKGECDDSDHYCDLPGLTLRLSSFAIEYSLTLLLS